MISDLRESGSIEQDADVVMLVHRPDAYNSEDRPVRQILLWQSIVTVQRLPLRLLSRDIFRALPIWLLTTARAFRTFRQDSNRLRSYYGIFSFSRLTPALGKWYALLLVRGGGTALPGKVVEAIDAGFMARTLAQLPYGVVLCVWNER